MKEFQSIFNSRFIYATFNPFGLFIKFNSLTRADFEEIVYNEFNIKNYNTYQIIFHEIRHFIDQISTYWGHYYLNLVFTSFDIALNDKDDTMGVIKILRKITLEKEYRCFNNFNNSISTYPKGEIWSWYPVIETNIPKKLENILSLPKLSIQFVANNAKICKAPLTISSLFEVNAITEEILFHENLFYGAPKWFQNKYEKGYLQNLLEDAYKPSQILYSIAAHLTSSILGIKTIQQAFIISSVVSNIVLNLPPNYIHRIPKENVLKEIKPFQDLLIESDYFGYLYYLLLQNYRPMYKEYRFSIDELLRANNLPSKIILEKEIIELMKTKLMSIDESSSFYNFHFSNVKNGIEMFMNRGLSGHKDGMKQIMGNYGFTYGFSDEIKTPIIDQILSKNIENTSISERIVLINHLKEKMKSYL